MWERKIIESEHAGADQTVNNENIKKRANKERAEVHGSLLLSTYWHIALDTGFNV